MGVASAAGAAAAGVGAAGAAAGSGRSAGRVGRGVFRAAVMSVAADRRGGHGGGAGQRVRRWRVGRRRGRRPVGVPGLGGGGGAVGGVVAASPLCGPPGSKVAGSRAADAEVHAIVAVAAVPAGMHAGGFPELVAHGARISIIM